MLPWPEPYFRHFPVASEFEAWGLLVSAVGHSRILPGGPYPPSVYPEDHFLDWSKGRVVSAYQIVFVREGRGVFETAESGLRKVTAGAAFLLRPGVRHHYRPDPAVGWEESWLELRGSTIEALARAGVLTADTAFRSGGAATGLDEAFLSVHERVFEAVPGFDPELVARAYRVLARWNEAAQPSPVLSSVSSAVVTAERYLAAHLTEPVNMEELAEELGVTYSHFRRAFKLHTGFSPWQYVLQLRLMRAQRLLAESQATLDDVAAGLGFNSAFHLSVSFKQAFGIAPSRWRKALGADVAAAQEES